MTTHGSHATLRRVRPGRAPRPLRSVAWLTARLIARGALAVALGLGALIVAEGLSFQTAYPDEASRRMLLLWGEDPSVRMIAGPATAADTVGGFAVWDAGLYLTLILGVWAVTTTTRVLRGEEESGRADHVHAGPVRARTVLIVQLAILVAGCLVIGGTIVLALAAIGAEPVGAALVGSAMAGYGSVLVAMTALASQVFGTRRGALAAAGGMLGAWVLLRMAANSAERREWLSWLTPVGWTDRLEAFGANRWPILLVPLGATILFTAGAVVLRVVRDGRGGLVRVRSTGVSRYWGLGSPIGFAWRMNLGVLTAWVAGIGAVGVVVGLLLPAVDGFLESDEGFADLLAAFGMDVDDLVLSFVAMLSAIVGVVIVFYAAFRMGAVRAEEASARAEMLLSRPVQRWRWLGGHVLALAAAVTVLSAVSAAGMWLGASASGSRVTASQAFSAAANVLPVIAVFAGLAVIAFGLVPRLTVPVTVGAAFVAYTMELVGPLLEWPEWVLASSPFHHLEQVPVDPAGLPAAFVMALVGVALTGMGALAFQRRDLVGG
jgi:ABC-2 type transport system permease protein